MRETDASFLEEVRCTLPACVLLRAVACWLSLC